MMWWTLYVVIAALLVIETQANTKPEQRPSLTSCLVFGLAWPLLLALILAMAMASRQVRNELAAGIRERILHRYRARVEARRQLEQMREMQKAVGRLQTEWERMTLKFGFAVCGEQKTVSLADLGAAELPGPEPTPESVTASLTPPALPRKPCGCGCHWPRKP